MEKEFQTSLKTLYVTLHELGELKQKSFFRITHRNASFSSICFVARLISKG